MPKKSRTPPPPKKIQAPKQRHESRRGLDPARQRTILYGVAGAGIVGLVAVIVVIFAGGGSGKAGNPQAIASTIRAAGCTLSTSKASPSAQHISSFSQKVTYSTYPPTSGRHYYNAAIWGNYTQAVDPRQAVHNEEHGGVVIWVGPGVSDTERKQIDSFYDESPNAMLVTPISDKASGVTYPAHKAPGADVYLTAWTVEIKNGNTAKGTNVVAACPHYSETAFKVFRDEFRGKGPERFPVSSLTPGT